MWPSLSPFGRRTAVPSTRSLAINWCGLVMTSVIAPLLLGLMKQINAITAERFRQHRAKSLEGERRRNGVRPSGSHRSSGPGTAHAENRAIILSRSGKDDEVHRGVRRGPRSGLVVDQKRRERRGAVAAGPGSAGRAIWRR